MSSIPAITSTTSTPTGIGRSIITIHRTARFWSSCTRSASAYTSIPTGYVLTTAASAPDIISTSICYHSETLPRSTVPRLGYRSIGSNGRRSTAASPPEW